MSVQIYGFLKGTDGLFHYTLVVDRNSPDGRAAEHLARQRALIPVRRGRNKILSRFRVDSSTHVVYAYQTIRADRFAVTKSIYDMFKSLRPRYTLTRRQRKGQVVMNHTR